MADAANSGMALSSQQQTSLLSLDANGKPILQRSASNQKTKTGASRRGFQKKIKLQSPDSMNCDSVEETASGATVLPEEFSKETTEVLAESSKAGSTSSSDMTSAAAVLTVATSSVADDASGASVVNDVSAALSKSSQSGTDFDIEELCRKRGLRRILTVIQDDDNAESEAEKISERLLGAKEITKVKETCRKTINTLDKLQRHFNIMKEKLYRARCVGMDQGIEAVQKGESPFLEQHMSRINNSYKEELEKAQALQKFRMDSIELEYQNAVETAWESLDSEIARKQKLRKAKLVEKLIANQCDFMQNQLRQICNHRKEITRSNSRGNSESTGVETTVEETFNDLWKLMKHSIREKYLAKYSQSESDPQISAADRGARKDFIKSALVKGHSETEKTQSLQNRRGTRKVDFRDSQKTMNSEVPSALRKQSNEGVEPIQRDSLLMEPSLNEVDLPSVVISIPE